MPKKRKSIDGQGEPKSQHPIDPSKSTSKKDTRTKGKKDKKKRLSELNSEALVPQNDEKNKVDVGAEAYEEFVSKSDAKKSMKGPKSEPEKFTFPKWETPCISFFQQSGPMDFRSYLRLKQEEKDAAVQYKAARLIQTVWRGFLTRSNMKELHACATKVQAFIRGSLSRMKTRPMFQDRVERMSEKKQNEAATKIEAAWRGYQSRKSKLNFKEYKKIQENNEALKRSIENINALEKVLVNKSPGKDSLKKRVDSLSSPSPADQKENPRPHLQNQQDQKDRPNQNQDQRHSQDHGDYMKTIENLITKSLPELANNMSDSRVAELYAYAMTSAGSGNVNRTSRDGKEIRRKSAKLEKLRVDSVGDLFPDFPDIDGLIKPDKDKVEALKQVIRLLQQQMKDREMRDLEKVHYLLRTSAQPGVYSDIYCNELTEIEQQLKNLKFWEEPPDPRRKSSHAGSGDGPQIDKMLGQSEIRKSHLPNSPIETTEYEGEYDETEGNYKYSTHGEYGRICLETEVEVETLENPIEYARRVSKPKDRKSK